jgi:hypothetical protein
MPNDFREVTEYCEYYNMVEQSCKKLKKVCEFHNNFGEYNRLMNYFNGSIEDCTDRSLKPKTLTF